MRSLPLLALLFFSCASGTAVDAHLLKGPWTSGGPSFDFDIGERTILFEFDMKEHPYTIEGRTVVIDFQDPALGIQRKRVLLLTEDVLEWQDEQYGVRGVYRRMR
jgi:hypothetical protein